MPEAPPSEAALIARLQKWADGKATLKDVRGYTDEELYSIARKSRLALLFSMTAVRQASWLLTEVQ